MNAQEIFDTAVSGVLSQGRPSVDYAGNCLYRGPNGLKCAAGFILTDGEARELEGYSLSEERCPERLLPLLPILRGVQGAHDTADPWPGMFLRQFKERARQVAEEHDLAWTHGD